MIAWSTVQAAIQNWIQTGSGFSDTAIRWAQQESGRAASGAWISLNLLDVNGVGLDWIELEENPLAVADDEVEDVDAGTDLLTLTAHGLLTGDGPIQFTTSDTLPDGLELATDYWVIKVNADAIQVADSFIHAMQGTEIDLIDEGLGTHTLVDTADTVRQGQEILYRVRGQREALLSVQCFAGVGGAAVGDTMPLAVLDAVKAAASLPTVLSALRTAGVSVDPGEVQNIGGTLGASVFEPRAVMNVRLRLAEDVTATGTIIEHVEVENLSTSQITWVPEDPGV